MDPLTLLRQFADEAIEVKEDAADPKSLILGDTRLHKTTPISLANKSFDLGQLWCFLLHKQHKNADKREYRKDCRAKGVSAVKILDTQDVVAFFTSELAEVAQSKAPQDEPQEAAAIIAEVDDGTHKGVVTTEKLIRTSASVLLGPCDYKERVFSLIDDLRRRDKEAARRLLKQKPGAAAENPAGPAAQPRSTAPPIIVVPLGRSATINMFNVKRFLEDGHFETVQHAMERKSTKESKIIVKGSKFVRDERLKCVEVVDSVKSLKDRDWPRVVAVLVQGPEWQFKDWPWKEIPEIFSRVTPFHVCFDDEAQHPNVVKWALKILTANKENRGKDMALVKLFWTYLSDSLSRRQASRSSSKRKRV